MLTRKKAAAAIPTEAPISLIPTENVAVAPIKQIWADTAPEDILLGKSMIKPLNKKVRTACI